ncbi:MAG: hypothetical protein CV087_17990 [Candidatus Brocadia sp. WS118]|nr:MAG: hypothetical protein CV087_17990 [Candidatus Brocadia sp. WS118]
MNHIFQTGNPKIEVIEVVGGLIGNGALEIQTQLYRRLDKDRCYQILDLEHVKQIDGLGIRVLENFLSRGLQIRLINVNPAVKSVIKMAKKESFFQIMYNEKDRDKAASLFEKDVLEKRLIPGDGFLKKRHHTRVTTSFPAEFKFLGNHGITSGKANILNLSEGGVLAGRIVVIKANTDEMLHCGGMIEKEVHDLKFKLNGDSTSITTQGKCVREFMDGESLSAGICFKDISRHQRESIRSFVDAHTEYSRETGR